VTGGRPASVVRIEGSETGDAGSAPLSWNASESERYLGWATNGRDGGAGLLAQIDGQLAAGGSVTSIDTVSGATFSSEAIAEAYGAALAKAAAAAGSNSASVASTPVTSKPSKANSSGNKGSKGSKDTSKADDDGKIDVEDDEPVEVANLADGSWVGYAVCGQDNEDDWSPYYVSVTVTVKDGKVTDVTEVRGTSKGEKGDPKLAWSEEDNKRYLDWATDGRTRGGVTYEGVLSQVKKALASGTSLGDIDVVSGATYSSNALVKACVAALKKSAEAAGGTYEEPAQDNDGGDDGSDKNDTREDDDADEDDAGEIADDGAGDASEDDALGDGGKADVGDDASDDADGDKTDGDGDTQETEPQGPALVDGEYVGKALCEDPDYVDDWEPYYVLVRIRVEDGSVKQVASAKPDDAGEVDPEVPFDRGNLAYFNRALNGTSKRSGISAQIQAKLPTRAEVSGIDVVSGATFSSRALIEAFRDAFGQVLEASSLED
ncbi:MAG: FMN-binding protein, partial [Atopobiaceae bacterium]|nr:FMN-binding protein [Atopobiaceae bacterium]